MWQATPHSHDDHAERRPDTCPPCNEITWAEMARAYRSGASQ